MQADILSYCGHFFARCHAVVPGVGDDFWTARCTLSNLIGRAVNRRSSRVGSERQLAYVSSAGRSTWLTSE